MHLKDLGNLANVFQEIINIGDVRGIEPDSIRYLKEKFKELSEAEIIAKLSTSGLSNELKQQIGEIVDVKISTEALSATQKIAAGSTIGLGTAFKGLISSIKAFVVANPVLSMAALTGAIIAAGVAIYTKLNPTIEQATEEYEKQKNELDSLTDEVESLSSELSTAKERLNELQSLGSISLVEADELQKLKAVTAELEIQSALKKEEARLKAIETYNAADNAYRAGFQTKYDDNGNYVPYRNFAKTSHDPMGEQKQKIPIKHHKNL